ncbi:50S ribosomal protein L23 [Candidatus Phytoplasma pini]|uniref:Large ribosomal subunit protein uL23 n=1 Tax=Candidatus Phytoplasma pini TaxID=267362 RepID=A0A559KJS4_9MOLU|nr:50S ribosomal protein L23 [Candidatus Phytoplasma pini]TVY12357.1 LSU ribosomal protein L23P [Candidatus Phytoplasma pini]
MNNTYYDILKSPVITEDTNKKMELYNKYTFKVDVKANKIEIKKAVEFVFNTKVFSVNTINVLPKFKRKGKYQGYTSAYKKAIVQLIPGRRIDIFHEK